MSDHRSSAGYRLVIARNLLLKALSEVASGSTRDTRIVGYRETLRAAE
jgi:xanthine dehydrogenase small subunit